MKLLRISMSVLSLLFLMSVSATSMAHAGENPLYAELELIVKNVDADNWIAAELHARHLDRKLDQKKWMHQLLGDENEYEGLNKQKMRLLSAVKEKDALQTKLIVSEIHSILHEIYSL